MITKIYAHILDEGRKVNAQKFETKVHLPYKSSGKRKTPKTFTARRLW